MPGEVWLDNQEEEEEEDRGCGCRSAGETRLSTLRGEDSRFVFREEDTGTHPQEKRRLDRQMDEAMTGWSDTRREGRTDGWMDGWRWEEGAVKVGSAHRGCLGTSRWI